MSIQHKYNIVKRTTYILLCMVMLILLYFIFVNESKGEEMTSQTKSKLVLELKEQTQKIKAEKKSEEEVYYENIIKCIKIDARQGKDTFYLHSGCDKSCSMAWRDKINNHNLYMTNTLKKLKELGFKIEKLNGVDKYLDKTKTHKGYIITWEDSQDKIDKK